jgi:4-carboxymuconolactone decarboxylase
MDKRKTGMEFFRKVNPEGAENIQRLLGDIAPDLLNQIVENAFGDLYQRTNLDPKLRQVVSLSVLAALNRPEELKIHIGIAKTIGFTKEELVEVFSQTAPFAGFPAAILGVKLVKEIF